MKMSFDISYILYHFKTKTFGNRTGIKISNLLQGVGLY